MKDKSGRTYEISRPALVVNIAGEKKKGKSSKTILSSPKKSHSGRKPTRHNDHQSGQGKTDHAVPHGPCTLFKTKAPPVLDPHLVDVVVDEAEQLAVVHDADVAGVLAEDLGGEVDPSHQYQLERALPVVEDGPVDGRRVAVEGGGRLET